MYAQKKSLYAYKNIFLRDADNSASPIRFVIMLLANEHPLSFCHLRFHEKITKGYRTLIEGLTEEHELTFCYFTTVIAKS